MLNAKLHAARRIREELLPSEDAIDDAIVRSARLVATIVEGRRHAGVALEMGHPAFMEASLGLASLADARDRLVRCHRELAATRDHNALSPRAVGCTFDKPKGEIASPVHLSAVEAA